MANGEQGFKTSVVGGFDKQDVLRYIEETKRYEAELVAGYESRMSILQNSVAARAAESDAARLQCAQECAAVRDECEKKLAAMSENIAALEAENSDMKKLIAQYELIGRNYEETERTLKEQCDKLSGDAEKLNGIELQLGTTIVEARRFADKLIEDARIKVGEINSDAYVTFGQTNARILNLTEYMKSFSDNFTSAFAQLVEKLSLLSSNIVSASVKMIPPEVDTVAASEE